jgi:hypothetical protein
LSEPRYLDTLLLAACWAVVFPPSPCRALSRRHPFSPCIRVLIYNIQLSLTHAIFYAVAPTIHATPYHTTPSACTHALYLTPTTIPRATTPHDPSSRVKNGGPPGIGHHLIGNETSGWPFKSKQSLVHPLNPSHPCLPQLGTANHATQPASSFDCCNQNNLSWTDHKQGRGKQTLRSPIVPAMTPCFIVTLSLLLRAICLHTVLQLSSTWPQG